MTNRQPDRSAPPPDAAGRSRVEDPAQAGRLVVDPLRTHILPPERCQEAYQGLTHRKDDYLGVVFDWTGSPVTP